MTQPRPQQRQRQRQRQRQLLAPEALTPLDFLRIRKTLGIDPYQAFGKGSDLEQEERMVLLVWAFTSRRDLAYTLEQAQALTFTEIADAFLFEGEGEGDQEQGEGEGEDVPPPVPVPVPEEATPELGANGTSPPKRAGSPTPRKRAGSGSARDAATTSA